MMLCSSVSKIDFFELKPKDSMCLPHDNPASFCQTSMQITRGLVWRNLLSGRKRLWSGAG